MTKRMFTVFFALLVIISLGCSTGQQVGFKPTPVVNTPVVATPTVFPTVAPTATLTAEQWKLAEKTWSDFVTSFNKTDKCRLAYTLGSVANLEHYVSELREISMYIIDSGAIKKIREIRLSYHGKQDALKAMWASCKVFPSLISQLLAPTPTYH